MKFFEYEDSYAMLKRNTGRAVPIDEFYSVLEAVASRELNPFSFRQAQLERIWIADQRPYYSVWPAIFPMVEKLKLDIPCSVVQTPLKVLCLRLPEPPNNPFTFDGQYVRSILFGHQEVSKQVGSTELVRGLCLAVDTGEKDVDTRFPIFTFKFFPLREDMTIEEAANVLPFHESWDHGQQMPASLVNNIVKLCCCICLIGSDPDLVTEDVLAKDRTAFIGADAEKRARLIDRAKRRGKYGFNVGSELTVNPHYRQSHLALFWTGKGRSVPIVQLRKGAVVHRQKLIDVPTGRSENGSV